MRLSEWFSFVALALAACSDDFSIKDAGGGDVARFERADSADPSDGGGSDTSSNDDRSGDTDSPADATADMLDASNCQSQMIMGTNGCITIMNAFCNTLSNKCNGMTLQQCSMWWAANYPQDYDCNASKYKKLVCFDDANKCANTEIPSYMCNKLQSSTPEQLGGACAKFFAEFP